MKKFSLFSCLILIFLLINSSFCLATGSGKTLEGLGIGPLVIGENESFETLQNKVNLILGAIQIAGYLIAAGMIVFVGVKYIMASGDEKADIKTALPKYCMGAMLIVFCDLIIGWIVNLFA